MRSLASEFFCRPAKYDIPWTWRIRPVVDVVAFIINSVYFVTRSKSLAAVRYGLNKIRVHDCGFVLALTWCCHTVHKFDIDVCNYKESTGVLNVVYLYIILCANSSEFGEILTQHSRIIFMLSSSLHYQPFSYR